MFKKIGDNQPIKAVFNPDGEEERCPHCGDKLIVIAMDDQDNKLVCTNCDEDDQ